MAINWTAVFKTLAVPMKNWRTFDSLYREKEVFNASGGSAAAILTPRLLMACGTDILASGNEYQQTDAQQVMSFMQGQISSMRSLRDSSVGLADALLVNSLKQDLDVEIFDPSAAEVRDIFIEKMRSDSQSVSGCTIGTINLTCGWGFNTSNVGKGQLVLSKQINKGDDTLVDNDRIYSEYISFKCVSDVPNDGVTAGNEKFDVAREGDTRFSIGEATDSITVVKPDVQTSTGNSYTPSGTPKQYVQDGGGFLLSGTGMASGLNYWTTTSGATNFGVNSSTYMCDANSLEASGAGAWRLEQFLSGSTWWLPAGKILGISFWARSESTMVASGHIHLKLGSGWSVPIDAYMDGTAGHLYPSTVWQEYHSFGIVPRDIMVTTYGSAGCKLLLYGSGLNHDVLVDNVTVFDAQELPGGIRGAIVRGDEDFIAGDEPDYFVASLSNADDGAWQTMFKRIGWPLLPVSTSPTVLDSWLE